ncbi:MAG: GNAT family N-acetyltransferase [Candidatus Bathyarchaeia archaeon]
MVKAAIRKANVNDIPAIIQTRLTSTSERETEGFGAPEWMTEWSVEEWRKMWAEENKLKDGSEVLVAEKENKIVGFIVFKEEVGYVYIDDVYVTKAEQRKGVGKALVTYVEDIAVARGFSCIKTDTTENAQGIPWKSYSFWIKMGYKDTGERLPTQWSFKTIPFVKNLKH